MKKIFAITIFCIFSLLLKNENANCKSTCNYPCNTIVKQSFFNPDMDIDTANKEPKQYDGFFFKI